MSTTSVPPRYDTAEPFIDERGAGANGPDISHVIAAEHAALAAVMEHTPAYDERGEILEKLSTEDFYHPANAAIFAALRDLYGRGKATTQPAVGAELDRRGELTRTGGMAYLAEIARANPMGTNGLQYAEDVQLYAFHRKASESTRHGALRIYQSGPHAARPRLEELVADAEGLLNGVVDDNDFGLMSDAVTEIAAGLDDDPEPPAAITGFADLDRLMQLEPAQLVLVAGRPAMGKSAYALGVARANAAAANPTLFVSMEMGKREIAQRVLAAQSRVMLHHIRGGKGHLDEAEWGRIGKGVVALAGHPLYQDLAARQTPSRIRARIRYVMRQHGGKPPLVIVDYLGLMETEPGVRASSQYERMTYLSREMKLIAKETGAVIMALAQLNRGPEQREDKKPLMSDLRDSGSLEQDADNIVLLHREDYYEKESPRAGEVDFIVAKHRNGPTSTVAAAAKLHYSLFTDMPQS